MKKFKVTDIHYPDKVYEKCHICETFPCTVEVTLESSGEIKKGDIMISCGGEHFRSYYTCSKNCANLLMLQHL